MENNLLHVISKVRYVIQKGSRSGLLWEVLLNGSHLGGR